MQKKYLTLVSNRSIFISQTELFPLTILRAPYSTLVKDTGLDVDALDPEEVKLLMSFRF